MHGMTIRTSTNGDFHLKTPTFSKTPLKKCIQTHKSGSKKCIRGCWGAEPPRSELTPKSWTFKN